MPSVTVRLSEELEKQVEETLVNSEYVSKSDLIRDLLRQWLNDRALRGKQEK